MVPVGGTWGTLPVCQFARPHLLPSCEPDVRESSRCVVSAGVFPAQATSFFRRSQEYLTMSIDGYWPLFPKNINEKVWQKKKGLLAIKKTGISEEIDKAEKSYETLKPRFYNRIAIDIDTPEGADEALKGVEGDAKNVKAFVKAMEEFATFCDKKEKEFKASKLISKSVAEFVGEMAADARKLSEDVVKHVETAKQEIQEALNAFNEGGNVPEASEKIQSVLLLIDGWDKVFTGKMRELTDMERELGMLEKEMDDRLEGRIASPAAELKEPFKRIRDESQRMQDDMLGKKAYAILKVVKEVRNITKTIKNDKDFIKNVSDPFERRAAKFLEEREKLNLLSSNLIGDAGIGFSTLQDGLKDEAAVVRELDKFAQIFYDKSSPNSVEKTREYITGINSYAKDIARSLKTVPVDKEGLRRLKQLIDDMVLKLETSTTALRGAVKTSAKLTRGRFAKNPMIGSTMRKMAEDVNDIVKDSKQPIEAHGKLAPLIERALV